MDHSAAAIMKEVLLIEGLFGDSEATSLPEWPLFEDHLPDRQTRIKVPDNAAVISSYTGRKDGRLMSGPVIVHPGFQIKVRSTIPRVGFRKAAAAAKRLSELTNYAVTVESADYTVAAITQTTDDPLFLGFEEGTKRRCLHTVNFTITVRQEA